MTRMSPGWTEDGWRMDGGRPSFEPVILQVHPPRRTCLPAFCSPGCLAASFPLHEDGPRVAVCLVLVCLLGLGQPGAHSPCPVWIAVVAPFPHDVVDSLCAYGLVGVRIPPCLAARMPPNIPKSILSSLLHVAEAAMNNLPKNRSVLDEGTQIRHANILSGV